MIGHILMGAIGGLIATLPMSIVMTLAGKWFRSHGDPSLPPQEISDKVIVNLNIDLPSRIWRNRMAIFFHFLFGTLLGSFFGLTIYCFPDAATFKGTLFGICVWVVCYAGFLPAFSLQPDLGRQPSGRNLIMLASHVVWGTFLGASIETWEGIL